MSDYVIDENVILNAVHGEKPMKKGVNIPADAEKIFVYSFFRNKDRNFINTKIRQKFFNMPKKVEQKFKKDFIDGKILPRFLDLLVNSDKFVLVNGIKNNFKGVKECDTEFVGVTLQSNAILVTS